MRRANYEIVAEVTASVVEKLPAGSLIIRDIGPWDQYPSVTNAAEDVVQELVASGRLLPGCRLFYYDSENQLDELMVKGNPLVFAGFAPGPKPGDAIPDLSIDPESIVGQITQECFIGNAANGVYVGKEKGVVMRPEFEDRLVKVIAELQRQLSEAKRAK